MEGFPAGTAGNTAAGKYVFDCTENTYLTHLLYAIVDLLLNFQSLLEPSSLKMCPGLLEQRRKAIDGGADGGLSPHRQGGDKLFVEAVEENLVRIGAVHPFQSVQIVGGVLYAQNLRVGDQAAGIVFVELNAGELGDVVNDHRKIGNCPHNVLVVGNDFIHTVQLHISSPTTNLA